MLKDVASLEILQAPGLTFKIPDLFASIPRLTGNLKPCTWPASLCHLSLPAAVAASAASAEEIQALSWLSWGGH